MSKSPISYKICGGCGAKLPPLGTFHSCSVLTTPRRSNSKLEALDRIATALERIAVKLEVWPHA